jgi:hypothetical protein
VVDLTKDSTAYTYVTQNLGYKQAPVVVVSDGKEQVSWSGHNPDMIHDHNLTRFRPADEDRVAQAATNTTAVIRNSGIGGRSTGPHLHFVGEYGPELNRTEGGVINIPADRGVEFGEALQAEARRQQED